MLIEEGKQKHRDLEERWEIFRNSVKDAATKTLGFQISENVRKPWIMQEMTEKMDERRRWKNVNTEEGKKRYRTLNNQLRRITDKAKEQWWNSQCDELEKLDSQGRMDLLYKKVSELTKGRRKRQNIRIRDKEGIVLREMEHVLGRWKEYVEELYDKENKLQKKRFLWKNL